MDSVVRPGQVKVGVPSLRDTTIHEPLEAQTLEGIEEEGEIREDPRTPTDKSVDALRRHNMKLRVQYLVCDPTWVGDELHLDDRGPFFHNLRCGRTSGNSNNLEEGERYHSITASRHHGITAP